MNVLVINIEQMLIEEVRELSNGTRITPYVAASREDAIGILETHPIDMVMFSLRTLADLELLKFLNTCYQHVEVVLTMEGNMHEIVNVLKHGKYHVLKTPFHVSELNGCLRRQERSPQYNPF